MSKKRIPQEFVGQYKNVFNGYCEYKRSLGFKFPTSEYHLLKKLNIYLNSLAEEEICLRKETVIGYLSGYEGKSASTIHNLECILRGLARYMANNGYKDVYILPESSLIKHTNNYVPFIFTSSEIGRILHSADSFVISRNRSHNDILFYQVIYRLLYATGMRVGEALDLKVEDVDLDNDIITIHNGKGDVSRLVPFLPSLHYWLEKYNNENPAEECDFFFHHQNKEKINRMCVRNNFLHRVLPIAGINPSRGNGRNIRVHDLRHTFACHCLDKAIKEGKDPFCVLPYLSTYMGHKDIKSTELYLRLTSEHYNDIIDAGHYIYEGLGDLYD